MQMRNDWQLSLLERSVAALDWLTDRRGRTPNTPAHLILGERGEEAAFFFLRRNGFCVVAQRWNDSPIPGDIDLIAWHEDVLCFIEVKSRSSHDVATASSAVDREKRKTLRRLTRHYLRHLPESDEPGAVPPTRFDIVTVYAVPGQSKEVRLIPGAFGWSER
jgi:putative endonuclease